MVLEMQFHSIQELADLQRLAAAADRPVYVASPDESIRVDARSFIGLFTLDYTHPVKVVTDSLYVLNRLEIGLRRQKAASVSG